jgi:hypothetical protein
MPLIQRTAPPELRSALATGVADFLNPNDRMTVDLARTPIGLQIFTLGLNDIASGSGIQAAKPAGWRFLTGELLGDVAAAEVFQPSSGTLAARMTSFSRDPIIAGALRAIQEVETLPEVQAAQYELQVLRIPGLLIEAFWLKAPDPAASLIVPVLTRARELQAMHPYTVAEFLSIVRGMTTHFLTFDDYPD